MGTRSTTKIYDGERLILALYKQWDGYTDSWGKKLKEFIKSKRVVNGYNMDEKNKVFNGAGCFALQLVVEFKDGTGDLYATTEGDLQEYNYVLKFEGKKVVIECLEDESFTETIEI